MNKSAKKKSIALTTPVPTTTPEAEALLFTIGEAQRQVAAIEVRMNEVLATARADFEAEAQPINTQIEQDFAALHVWAEAHKEALLIGKLKTARLATGEVSWRTSPPSVRVTKVDDVIKRLRALALDRFVRTKEEIDKEAVLREPDAVEAIKGIEISQKEEFVAKPHQSTIEKAATAVTAKAVRHG